MIGSRSGRMLRSARRAVSVLLLAVTGVAVQPA
jgi:hypothetical protein